MMGKVQEELEQLTYTDKEEDTLEFRRVSSLMVRMQPQWSDIRDSPFPGTDKTVVSYQSLGVDLITDP